MTAPDDYWSRYGARWSKTCLKLAVVAVLIDVVVWVVFVRADLGVLLILLPISAAVAGWVWGSIVNFLVAVPRRRKSRPS